MFTKFQLAKKYIGYYLTASNGNGHGIHSPFVFDFIKNVLRDKRQYPWYPAIEARRNQLLQQTNSIEVEDFGAGSTVIKTKKRVIADIAASSLKPKKYARLLSRIVQHYKPQTIIELGTSFGITSAYMAAGNSHARLYTLEGAEAIAGIAQQTFTGLDLQHVELVKGDFSKTLPPLLAKLGVVDLAFIDGNHRAAPTLEYFEQVLKSAGAHTILIFDDIHWSVDMEQAWAAITKHHAVTLTIDLFFLGLVFINPDFKIPQHYRIRF